MSKLAYTSIEEQAKAEVVAEERKLAVGDLKVMYKNLRKAETIVANLKREIDDYVRASEDGNA